MSPHTPEHGTEELAAMQTGADSTLGLSQVRGASGRKRERAGRAKPVQWEHPKGGALLGSHSNISIPLNPEQLLRERRLLSPEHQMSMWPTPIRGVALGQSGQAACKPGAGPGPDCVNEDQPGWANSNC